MLKPYLTFQINKARHHTEDGPKQGYPVAMTVGVATDQSGEAALIISCERTHFKISYETRITAGKETDISILAMAMYSIGGDQPGLTQAFFDTLDRCNDLPVRYTPENLPTGLTATIRLPYIEGYFVISK